MKLAVRNSKGEAAGSVNLSDVVFGAPLNHALVHQVMVYHQANQRQGSSNTLTRAHVSGGGRKPFAQKHTGRARMGSIRSPIARHGGVVFGPHPRSYRGRIPVRMRRQAIRSALSGKVSAERLVLVDKFELDGPKTKAMAGVLAALGVSRSALIVVHGEGRDVPLAVRNLPRIKTLAADLLNVLDLLRYDTVVMTLEAAKRVEALWTKTESRRKEAAGAA